jgi:hypothetical protein
MASWRCGAFGAGRGTKFSLNHDLPRTKPKISAEEKKSEPSRASRQTRNVLRVSAWPGEWKVCSFVKGADSFDTVLSSSITIVYERRPASKYLKVDYGFAERGRFPILRLASNSTDPQLCSDDSPLS